MKKIVVLPLLALIVLSLACSISFDAPQIVAGSGNVTSESRPASGFSGVELASSADITIRIGESESVVVETDDNILPLIQTNVRGGTLFIETKPNTSITTNTPVRVEISMPSLDRARISGSGDIKIEGLNAQEVTFELPGSGNITAAGAAESVNVTMSGSGNITCGDLQAKSATVKISGSGNVTVFASEKLSASIPGSGTINYRGNPAEVDENVSGSGNISPIP